MFSLFYRPFGRKESTLEVLGLNGQEFGKARKKIRGNRVCEGDRA
jgi:hypothetical protein